jgi:prepilin-type N-terminal cleavage/methylation domain-containing protein
MISIFPNSKYNKSFTLIELLVVIAIIGLLSSVVLVSLRGAGEKTQIAKGLDFNNSIQNTLGVDAVGIWDFDEGSGTTINDSSGFGNNGTLSDSLAWRCASTDSNYTPSGQGCSLNLDGASNFVEISPSQDFAAGNLTISAWINADDFTQWRGLLFIYEIASSDYFIIRNDGTKLQLLIEDGDITEINLATPVLEINKWLHVVFVQDGTAWKFYKNGKKETLTGTNGGYGTSHLAVNVVRIGYSSWPSYYFNGFVDEVRIYETALSSAQIQSQYYTGLDRLLAEGLIEKEELEQRLIIN